MANWKKNIITSLCLLALNIVLFVNGVQTLKESAFLYPRAVIILCSACCLILLIQGIVGMVKEIKAPSKEEASAADAVSEEDAQRKKAVAKSTVISIAVCCGAMVLYIIAIRYIGYILSTLLFIGGVLYFLRIRKFWIIAATSVGVTAFLYIMFNYVLMVTLPVGSLFYNLLY